MSDKARKQINPKGFPPLDFPGSYGIEAGGWIFSSAQYGSDLVNGLLPEAQINPKNPNLADPTEKQSWVLMDRLSQIYAAAGADVNADSVRIQQWRYAEHPTMEEFEAGSTWTGLSVTPYYRARNHYLKEPRPASTGMGVRNLLVRDGVIGVDMIGIHPDDGNQKTGVGVPEGVASPLAGYSPAILRGDWVFLAGEIATDWKGDFMSERHMGAPSSVAPEARVNPYFWYGSEIEAQTDHVLQKLEKIAQAAGTSLDRCVKANVYLGPTSDFEGMDRVWKQWFPENPPARVTIPYMGLGGMGCRIEVDMILLNNDSDLPREAIQTENAFEPLGHEPQAMRGGDFVFFSTQLPTGPEGIDDALLANPELPYTRDEARLQAATLADNMSAICEAAGTTLDNMCQVKQFHTDLTHFPSVRAEWETRFGNGLPAATAVEIGGPLIAPGCALQLDAIGYAG